MLFNSFEFLGFLLVVYAMYTVLTHRWQNWLLLVGSYVFYGRWDWRFLSLIMISTVVDYFAGQWIHAARTQGRKKALLTMSMVTNLGILGTFKYFNFFADSLADLVGGFGVTLDWRFTSLVLPVGISFYTFQTMSYTIDIYRDQMKPTKHFWDFALFVSFFPQLVAGPIERASRLLPQVESERRITYEGIRAGAWLILLGYFKKVVIADNLSHFTEPVFSNPGAAGGMTTLLALYAFTWQIYGDFAGYTDIARGVSRLMGFDLMLNFKMPYFATNPSDFWRRWHISLSTWLRDYLFVPLGGSRGSVRATLRNIVITMLLGGLWHGASWHFVVWGGYYGVIQVIHTMLKHRIRALRQRAVPVVGQRCWHIACVVFYFHLGCFGMLLFATRKLSDVPIHLANLIGPWHTVDWLGVATILMLVGPLFVYQLIKERSGDMLVIKQWPAPVRLAAYCFVFAGIILCGVAEQHEFIYFQF